MDETVHVLVNESDYLCALEVRTRFDIGGVSTCIPPHFEWLRFCPRDSSACLHGLRLTIYSEHIILETRDLRPSLCTYS